MPRAMAYEGFAGQRERLAGILEALRSGGSSSRATRKGRCQESLNAFRLPEIFNVISKKMQPFQPLTTSSNKGQVLDDELGNDFQTSWKPDNNKEDRVDFPDSSIPTSRKNKFNLENLDMDFSFDGGFEKFSSFKVDMSDFDFSSPPKIGQLPKETKQRQADKEKSDKASEDFIFNFNFNDLEGFNLSPGSPKKGCSSKEALDAKSRLPSTYDETVENRLSKSMQPSENKTDEVLKLDSGPTSHSRSTDVITGVSEAMLQTRQAESSYEVIQNTSHIVAPSAVGPKINALAGKERYEETEGLHKDATVKCTTEFEDHESVKDFPPKTVFDSNQLDDPSSKSGVSAGLSCHKDDTVPSTGSLYKSLITSKLGPLTHIPSTSSRECNTSDNNTETAPLSPEIDAQGPEVLRRELSCTIHGESTDVTLDKEGNGKASPYFLQPLGPKHFGADGHKIGIKQNDENSEPKKFRNLSSSEERTLSLSSTEKNNKASSSIGKSFSLFSGATLDRKQNICIPKIGSRRTLDHADAAVILTDAKEPSSTLRSNHGREFLNTKTGMNYNGVSERKTKGLVPETDMRVISSLKFSRSIRENGDLSISDQEGKHSMSKIEKSRPAISSLKLRTLATDGDSSTSRTQMDLKSFNASGDKKVDMGTSLKKIKFNFSEMASLSSPYVKPNQDQGPTVREFTHSPLKHVMESPLLESRKRCKKGQIFEKKEVLDTKNVECSPKAIMHDLVSVDSVPYATFESTTIDMGSSSLLDRQSTIQKVEAYAKDLEDIRNKLQKMNEEAQEVLVRAVVNNNFLLLLNHSMVDVKIHALQSLACSMMAKNYEG